MWFMTQKLGFSYVQWIKHFGLCAKEQNKSMMISKQ